MKIINGKLIAARFNKILKVKIDKLKKKHNIDLKLVVILIGDNPASKVYVKNKSIKAEELGIISVVKNLDAEVKEKELLELISNYNNDTSIDGILLQLPIPNHINKEKVIDKISVEKDVDGFNSKNIGLLALGRPQVVPCTPLGCLKLLKTETSLSGKNVIIIGRSNIVGRPLSFLLTNENSTVTLAHSKTKNLQDLCKDKDIIIAATGIPKMISKDWVNEKSIIIDVGINQVLNKDKKKNTCRRCRFSKYSSKSKSSNACTWRRGTYDNPLSIAEYI